MRAYKDNQCLYCSLSGGHTRDAEGQLSSGNSGDSRLNAYFPHPAVQAMFLLDETENDLFAAMELALIISTKEDIADARYWVAVADALMMSEEQN